SRLGRERRQRGKAAIPGDRLVEVLEEGRLRAGNGSAGVLRWQRRRGEEQRKQQDRPSHARSFAATSRRERNLTQRPQPRSPGDDSTLARDTLSGPPAPILVHGRQRASDPR